MNAMGSHMDPQLVDKIVHEVKSQGVFDEFRKDSMSDVDTKPAYQNLRQRVENTVKKFLSEQRWSPEMNKNQLRERLRKHITESGFLDVGVERIVDQVVNPKIGSVFQPRIEEIAYKYLGLPPPIIKCEPPAPIMPPLPPLPMNGTPLKIETNSSLLPTGLEQVSPDSDKATLKSEYKDEDQSATDMEIDEKIGEDDDESPPFEPLVKCAEASIKKEKDVKSESPEENSNANDEAPPLKIEQSIEENMAQDESVNMETQDTSASELDREASVSFDVDVVASQESQLSQVSSDSHISEVTATASHSFMESSNAAQTTQTLTDQIDVVMQKAPVNISEEAQMPKFNENSSDTNIGGKSVASHLHFDIKKDEIKFEGTERKSSIMEQDGDCVLTLEGENSSVKSAVVNDNIKKENEPCQFGNIDTNADVTPATTLTPPTATPTPTPHDSSFGSSLEDASNQLYAEKSQTDPMAIVADTTLATVNVLQQPEQSEKKENGHAIGHSSSSSSSRHKKHSKDKRRSHESKDKYREKDKERDKDKDKERNREKDKDREKEKDKDREKEKEKERDRISKDKNKDGDKDKEKDKDKERSRDRDKDRDKSRDKHSKSKYSSTTTTSSTAERSSSSSKRSSSSKTEKTVSSKQTTFAGSSCSSSRSESHDTKREKRDGDKKHQHSGSSSKKPERKPEIVTDDHGILKDRLQRRKSTDSNDEDKNAGGTGNCGRNNNTSSSTTNNNGNDSQQQQNDKNNSSNTDKTKSKTEKNGYDELEQKEANTVTEVRHKDGPGYIDVNDNQFLSQNQRSKVVILNDMLQNPNIHYIELGTTMKTHTNSMAHAQISRTATTTDTAASNQCSSDNLNSIDTSISKECITKDFVANDNIDGKELCFFEEINGQFSERLRLLDNAMYRCRRVVNNLRFDCATTDTSELFESDAPQAAKNDLLLQQQADRRNLLPTRATLTIDCIPAYTGMNREQNELSASEYCDGYGMHGKRSKRSVDEHQMREKPSPTPSDTSVNSKENMSLDKNAVDPSEERRHITLNKLRQQRYSSEDLYKPRPVLSQRSRRRGVDSVI